MLRGILKGISVAAVVLLATAWLVTGCGKLDNKGSEPENAPPEVFLANIPIEDSEWWRNPVIHWYATDEDGYVTKYRYAVIQCDSVDNVDDFMEESRKSKFRDWETVDVSAGNVSTSGTIWLYADPVCDSCWVCDYFFIQAEDNFGDQSNILYRQFLRGNHAPETFLTTPRGAQVTGSCCEYQTQTLGITVMWEGEDTLDYPGRQPDFYFSWDVYGPFTGEFDSLGAARPDTQDVIWEQWVVDSSWNDRTQSRWVMDEAVTLRNLFRNVPSTGETTFGYFVFKVRTRDDAYVADPTPAIGTFMAIQPECELGILLIDMTSYGVSGLGSLYGRAPKCPPVVDSLYHPYFKSVVEYGYGDTIDGFYDAHKAKLRPPSIEMYSKYKLVIVLAEDAWNGTPVSWLNFMYTYMNLGGKVMLMGVDHFAWTDVYDDYPYMESQINPGALTFFDIRKQWVANWTGSYYRAYLDPNIDRSNEEFMEGLSTAPDLPNVRPDSARLAYYIGLGNRIVVGEKPYAWYKNTIPGVNFFVSGGRAERVYVAKSVYGRDGYIDGGPCGYRFSMPCFKSAIFGFPLWALEEQSAREFMRGMIDWFDIR